MTFFTRDTQVSRVRIRRIFVHHFEFSLKTADLAARLLLSCAHDLPEGGDLCPFHRKFINCLLKHCEIWKKDQLSTKNCSDISELEDNLRNCSECKKLPEIREVAKKLPSNLWKALTLVKLINLQRKKILYDARKGRLHSKRAKVLRVILGRSLI